MPGPTRFWPQHAGPPPVAEVTISPRETQVPVSYPVEVDLVLLDAGDHNGATFFNTRNLQLWFATGHPLT